MRDNDFIARAAELALEGRFRVEPNPLVGCVLVKRGRIIAEGHHARWGGPHAEAMALRRAGKKARGATAYVTLEPCAHRGKTPPCADALVRAGVKEVVYASADPSPATAGLGPKRLREAGIAVRRVRSPGSARGLIAPHVAQLDRKRPWVIAKWAMTLDGHIATRDGDSKWVTGEKTRRWAHANLRATIDGIVAGAGTVLKDDPSLTNRSRVGRQPTRIVVCGRRLLWPRLKVLSDGGTTLLAAPKQFRAPAGVESFEAGRAWRVDVRRLLRELHRRGMRRILIEGGGELLGSFFDAGLVDQVAVFTAPKVVGGISAVQPVGGKGRARMKFAHALTHVQRTDLAPDWLVEGYVRSS
ncbi:MAG: bifunctional diaminohydroxyphosphoribosylaminopyrimidine deaminase/5-amino-6-(5-phosphoribosylamino)uracil reductase RibD [Planctomycetota bacterium]